MEKKTGAAPVGSSELQMCRRYICEQIKNITHEESQHVYRFLSTCVDSSMFTVHGNGTSINMDDVSEEVVMQVYSLIKQKLEQDDYESSGDESLEGGRTNR